MRRPPARDIEVRQKKIVPGVFMSYLFIFFFFYFGKLQRLYKESCCFVDNVLVWWQLATKVVSAKYCHGLCNISFLHCRVQLAQPHSCLLGPMYSPYTQQPWVLQQVTFLPFTSSPPSLVV